MSEIPENVPLTSARLVRQDLLLEGMVGLRLPGIVLRFSMQPRPNTLPLSEPDTRVLLPNLDIQLASPAIWLLKSLGWSLNHCSRCVRLL